MMSEPSVQGIRIPAGGLNQLRARLDACPAGTAGWREFEETAIAILTQLFVPPLRPPMVESRTINGTERRDAIFGNLARDANDQSWGLLYHDHQARFVVVEFKNYDRAEVGSDEVNQLNNYIRSHWGNLAILCCNKPPNSSAHARRNTLYSDRRRVVLFITSEDLKEMLDIQERGDDPFSFIIDSIEAFLVQHE